MTTTKKVGSAAVNDKAVRKYPANELKKPFKKFSETFRAVTVLKKEFFA